MNIAITGSREGMTRQQRVACSTILRAWGATVITHGDCIGVDEEADAIAERLGIARRCYPGDIERYRAHTGALQLSHPLPPMERNGLIVRADAVAAFPRPSSRGTWDAVRKAMRLGVPVLAIAEPGVSYRNLRGVMVPT